MAVAMTAQPNQRPIDMGMVMGGLLSGRTLDAGVKAGNGADASADRSVWWMASRRMINGVDVA